MSFLKKHWKKAASATLQTNAVFASALITGAAVGPTPMTVALIMSAGTAAVSFIACLFMASELEKITHQGPEANTGDNIEDPRP